MSALLKRLLRVIGLWLWPGLGTVASIVGIAGGIAGLSQLGGGGGGGMQWLYYPQSLPTADNAFWNLSNQGNNIATGLTGAVDPTLRAILSNRLGQDYSGLLAQSPQIAQQYAQMAALDPTYAALLRGAGVGQIGAGNTGLAAGQQLVNTAFDPMGNAKADLWNQILNSTRAGDASRGIVMSPTSAGIEGRTAVDFNTAWDMNNLQRQTTGLSGLQSAINGANTAYSSAGNLFGGSDAFTNSGINANINAATTPQMLAEIINKAKMGALSDYTTGVSSMELAPLASQAGPLLDYMGLGNQAGATSANAFNMDRNFRAGQDQQSAYALAQGFNGLNKAYPNMFNTGSGGGYTPSGNNPNAYSNMATYGNAGSGGGANYSYT